MGNDVAAEHLTEIGVNDFSFSQRSAVGYLQTDFAAREPLFAEFLAALRALKGQGHADEARTLAARAVSPLLDYSSLLKLAPILHDAHRAADRAAASNNVNAALRLGILGGPTTIQLRQLIEIFLAGEGIAASIFEAEYGTFRQELLTPGSDLDAFAPHIVFIATSARDLARRPRLDQDETSVARLAEEELGDWQRLWEVARSRWEATVIQNNFDVAPTGVMGHFHLRHPAVWENFVDRMNRLFSEKAPAHVVLHDQRGLAAEVGTRQWFDARLYYEFKLPCGSECLVTYAHSVVSLIRALLGRSKKVLVLDLDNTLWGGVVGDLGAGGIRLGQGSGEGEAFLAFQQYTKELQQRGVVLAVCSKNEEKHARAPFEQRADMALKFEDIACFVANWRNKADNLRDIASRLELNLDSFVFVDDNPAERSLVRRFLPEVAVPDLPEDPAGYIPALAANRYFETVAFTREDASRGRLYADRARRQDMAAKAVDLDAFLSSLDMRMTVEPIHDLNIERATQLLNKSNQFNLTTKRQTLSQVREVARSPQWRTLTLSLKDRFGDNGLIAVLLLRVAGRVAEIDTWVMSCRVLQRGVEQMTRNELVALARAAWCTRIRGTFVPTAKNSLVKDLLPSLGFAPDGVDNERTYWALDLDPEPRPLPHHIQREAPRHGY